MTSILHSAARYNEWANARFIGLLRTLDEKLLDIPIASSFDSVRKTVLHMWGAEDVWLQRFLGVPQPVWKPAQFEGPTAMLLDAWAEASAALVTFADTLQEPGDSERIVSAINLKGIPVSDPLGDALYHVFSHSAYHRGQLVTMLRQAGVTEIPSTDYILYTRNR